MNIRKNQMNSIELQQSVLDWINTRTFNAPYGILSGNGVNEKGNKYLYITFGRARVLDCTIKIYNSNFIVVRTNSRSTQIFKNRNDLMYFLLTL